jgi:apolipoprotein N-acyltransferase
VPPPTPYDEARRAIRRGHLASPWAKFGLLPFALAVPAFRLHQHIAYGSAFGEFQNFGLGAYLTSFALWWAAWAIGVTLCAAALRAAIEAAALLAALLRPSAAAATRRALEGLGLAALYLGLPAWLAWRALGA